MASGNRKLSLPRFATPILVVGFANLVLVFFFAHLYLPLPTFDHESTIIAMKRIAQNSKIGVPAKCGVYYFYHIGKCGGTSISSWMEELAKSNPNDFEYVNWWWQLDEWTGKFDWRVGLSKVEEQIRSGMLQTNSKHWLLLHHHHGAPGLRYMMLQFQEWKKMLNNQGCDLILTTVLRDPYSRVFSLIHYNHVPIEEFYQFVSNSEEISQSKYLLFNRGANKIPWLEPHHLEENHWSNRTVMELAGYLTQNFQIIGDTSKLDDFISQSELLSGFSKFSSKNTKGKALSKNKGSSAPYNFTTKMKAFLEPYLVFDRILMERLFEMDHRKDPFA